MESGFDCETLIGSTEMDLLKESPKSAAIIAFWMAFVFFGVANFFTFRAIYLSRVSFRQREVSAIIESNYRNHQDLIYLYKFTAKDSGDYHASSPAPEGRSYDVGQVVTAYYDPLYPTTNSLVRFSAMRPTDWIGVSGLMLIPSGVLVIYGMRLWRRKPMAG